MAGRPETQRQPLGRDLRPADERRHARQADFQRSACVEVAGVSVSRGRRAAAGRRSFGCWKSRRHLAYQGQGQKSSAVRARLRDYPSGPEPIQSQLHRPVAGHRRGETEDAP